MGNAPSRSPEVISTDVISSLSPNGQQRLKDMAYPNFFEFASLAVDGDSTRTDSISSNKSTISQETVKTRLSQNSSILKVSKLQCEYEYLDGRPYIISDHGFFFLPCDDDESDRMVILHFLMKLAFNGNFVSPVVQSLRMTHEDNKESIHPKVLDIGCGPGTWILEMGTEYPNAEFYGIDIRTMFPNTIKPPNTHFIKCDFLQNLPFEDNTFVFIRMRLLLGSITQSELLHLLSEIYRTLKPGGYYELQDCEYVFHRPGPLSKKIFNTTLKNSFSKHGIGAVTRQHISTLLMTRPADRGFIDIHQHSMAIPIGWGGQMGDLHLQNLTTFLKSIHPCIRYSLCPHDKSIVNSVIDEAVSECTVFRSHLNWFVCYCQKPEDPVPPMVDITSSEMMMQPMLESSMENMFKSYKNEGYFNTLEYISDFSDGYID